MPPRILVAPQEYKGTLTADEATRAIAAGVRRAAPAADVLEVPLADGGPGTVRVVISGAGGSFHCSTVTGPMGEPVEAEWGQLDDGTAVIEMAAAAGLVLVTEAERDPRLATTYGIGELICAALNAGCRRIIVGLGGSATNDGGAGMAQALGARLPDADGGELRPGGAALARLAHIDISGLDPRLKGIEVIAATDVRNPLCGPDGASIVYAPQKGATPAQAESLDRAMRHYAEVIRRDLGVDVADVPGSGSAGGLGAGLVAFLGARIRPGIEIVAEVVRLRELLAGADVMVTGEGRLDGQTGWGKTVAGALAIARVYGVPAIIVPGTLGPGWERVQAEIIDPASAEGEGIPAEPAAALAGAAERAVRGWLAGR